MNKNKDNYIKNIIQYCLGCGELLVHTKTKTHSYNSDSGLPHILHLFECPKIGKWWNKNPYKHPYLLIHEYNNKYNPTTQGLNDAIYIT